MNRPWQARTQNGERIYAIGDVHGCHAEMLALLALIEKDNQERGEADASIIFLGDLIDRGPDSRGVLQTLIDLTEDYDNVVVLRGNHEQAFLAIAGGDTGLVRDWLRMGGRRTLRSYGIDPDQAGENPELLPEMIGRKVPRQHLKWLGKLPLSARSGDYFFCHAGVRPQVRLSRQSSDDLLWIRHEFLDYEAPHEAVIVHGHHIESEVQVRPNRIGVDTGAYKTAKLSAIMLEGRQYHALSTAKG